MERVLTIIIPFHNGEKSLSSVLSSLQKQKNQELVKEIVFINEASKDNGPEIVQQFISTTGYKTRSITHDSAIGLAKTYNQAILETTTEFFILMHQDVVLEREDSFTKILEPLQKSSDCVASYPELTLPLAVWNNYNFWQKCLFARVVDKEVSSGNGKFDCYRKDTFLLIGGYDVVNYGHNIGIGSEDADLYIRLRDVGSIVVSKAKVIHLHNLSKDYSFWSWINNRKFMGRSYGRLLRIQGRKLFGSKALLLGIKPMLVLVSFLPIFFPLSLIVLFLYGIASMNIMYRTKDTITNPRIVLLPFIAIFFIYYEVFWMLEAFLSIEKK